MSGDVDRLPHRGLARLIVSVERASASETCCVARIPADHPAVEDGVAPATVALELGAQAAALMASAAGGEEPGARVAGRIVSVRQLDVVGHGVAAGRNLAVTVRLVADARPLRIYEFDVPGVGSGEVGVYAG